MLFNSLHFLLFFLIVAPSYFLLPHRDRWKLLLLASCYFYMTFVPAYILILGFTIVVDYFAGILIENAEGKRRKQYLILSLAGNIGVLAVFKYYNFLNDNLSFLLRNFNLPKRMMTNVKGPYLAKSIKEFWFRWGIYLSTWFETMYISLRAVIRFPFLGGI